MKRILTGIDAFNKMLTTPLPEKTKTYTPVSHREVMSLVRTQLGFLGFKLQNEMYTCNQSGTVATVASVFEFVDDPEMSMSAIFVNSYDKSTKFQFKLGGMSKKHGTLIISDGFAGSHIRRKHTGSAVEIINDHIIESLNGTALVWKDLLNCKHLLQNLNIATNADPSASIIGKMILSDVVDSTQMSAIRELLRSSDSILTLWDYYHICASALRSTHPKLWHSAHSRLTGIFLDVYAQFDSDNTGDAVMALEVKPPMGYHALYEEENEPVEVHLAPF